MPIATTAWHIAGTDTFRLASRKLLENKPFCNGYGSNLQNLTDRQSRIFIAPKGKKFISCDQSGAEAFIVSYLCKPGCKYRELFANGIKPHSFVALHIFTKQIEKLWGKGSLDAFTASPISKLRSITGFKELFDFIKSTDGLPPRLRFYFIAKQVCHSSNYDASDSALITNTLQKSDGAIVLTKQEAGLFLDILHNQLFPEIRGCFHKDVELLLRTTRTLRNLFGYPKEYYYSVITPKLLREAYAFIPQSTVATITNIAYTQLQTIIEEEHLLGWDMLNNKHDSVMGQFPEDDIPQAAWLVKSFLEQELVSPYGEKFRMKAEVSIGSNWGKYDSENNPEGLKEYKFPT